MVVRQKPNVRLLTRCYEQGCGREKKALSLEPWLLLRRSLRFITRWSAEHCGDEPGSSTEEIEHEKHGDRSEEREGESSH